MVMMAASALVPSVALGESNDTLNPSSVRTATPQAAPEGSFTEAPSPVSKTELEKVKPGLPAPTGFGSVTITCSWYTPPGGTVASPIFKERPGKGSGLEAL